MKGYILSANSNWETFRVIFYSAVWNISFLFFFLHVRCPEIYNNNAYQPTKDPHTLQPGGDSNPRSSVLNAKTLTTTYDLFFNRT
jgi:hypothetical protein